MTESTACYATCDCPHLTRDMIDNPILLAALDITDAFLIAANRAEPAPNLDYPSLFDHYALAATINSDADFDCLRCMTATIALDDELHSIAIMITYDPDFDSPIRHIMLCADLNLDMIFNATDPTFDPHASR